MRKTILALSISLFTGQVVGKEATLLYEGYHFRVPVDFDQSNMILLNPEKLPKNMFIKDFGLKKTVPYQGTQISLVEGGGEHTKPRLSYRGKSIGNLIEEMRFPEVASLLAFNDGKAHNYQPEDLPEEIQNALYLTVNATHHPADFFAAYLQLLALGQSGKPAKDIAHYLLNVMPTYAANSCRIVSGMKGFVQPKQGVGMAENFLHMYWGDDFAKQDLKVQQAFIKALDSILIVHADHGVNASTATVRNAASAGANLVSSISSGCQVLFGPLHGAANQKVIEMLLEIGDRENVRAAVEKAKSDKNYRLMGFGHRVYKGPDPRALIVKQQVIALITLLKETNYAFSPHVEKLLDTALELEKVAGRDAYFKERGIYPNVDFYAAIFYQLIGLPAQANTVMFAFARLSGWIAHWFEQHENPTPIMRPRIGYVGDRDAVTTKS